MSYHVFFGFSTSFSKTLRVPQGTLGRIWGRIKYTEETLGLKRTPTYTPEGESPRPGWGWSDRAKDMLAQAGPEIDTSLPQWWLADRERDARDLWDREHYTDHMEHLHELLTTGSSRGTDLDCKPFNPKQASALLVLFEDAIDQWGFDARFEIPLDAHLKPYNCIASSYDGGYDWCSRCGPIHSDDFHDRCRICPHVKRGKCDLKNEHPGEFE